MNVREAREEERQQWDDFVLGADGVFLQTWAWGQVQETMGLKVWRLVVEQEGGWCAVATVVQRELPLGLSWLYVPAGLAGQFSSSNFQFSNAVTIELNDYLKNLGKQERAVFWRVDSFIEKTETPPSLPFEKGRSAAWDIQPRHTLVLDLTQSEEELLAQMKSKTRYNVRLAERKGVTVRFSREVADVNLFWQLAEQVQERTAFHYHPKKYYEAIVRYLNVGIPPDKGGVGGSGEDVQTPSVSPLSGGGPASELAIAEYEGEVLAVHLMVYAGKRAVYLHGASSREKRELQAPMKLYWETTRWAKELGCTVFDFWGVAPENADKDHPWAGITRVKEGFGGRRVEYMEGQDLVLRPLLYNAIRLARRLKSSLKF